MSAPATLLALLLAALAATLTGAADPVKVSVYHETLCPDSKAFYVNQLYPVWQELKDIMTLDVHTYGKASDTAVGDGFTFVCQHGPDECEGNMMVTCAKKYIESEDTFMHFSNCVMDRFIGAAAGEECARAAGFDFTQTQDCYNSVEGQQLLHEVGVQQGNLDPQLYYVPWIIINDVFTEENLSAAQEDLKELVCDTYQGEKPDACST